MTHPVDDPRSEEEPRSAEPFDEARILRVRLGHGANCSSIGSLVDTMFAIATIGGAVFASVVAAMGTEPIRVVGEAPERHDGGPSVPEEESASSGPRASSSRRSPSRGRP